VSDVVVTRWIAASPPMVFAFLPTQSAGLPGRASAERSMLEPADGGTMVRLTHTGLQSANMRELHRSGWDRYLDRLTRRATGVDPGPDRFDD
jgi:hypothetical protein